jgi:SAM-dependent methyltransferase
MAIITSLQREHILESVRSMYTDVAQFPERQFHFPTGRAACEFVGYPKAQLDAIPASAAESFAGVGYPFAASAIRKGNTVLDIGSGSGTDALIASLIVGDTGKCYALDMTSAMREKLKSNAIKADRTNIEVLEGEAESIPLPDACVDAVTSNGVLNLVPDKKKAFKEIFRVLKSGGRVQIADIVVSQEISPDCRSNPKLWAECIVGAMEKEDYLGLFREIGFDDVAAIHSMDYFSGSSSESTRKVASSLGAHAIVMKATRNLGRGIPSAASK